MVFEPPLIIAITDDLFLLPRLEDAARDLGFRFSVVESADPGETGADSPPRPIPLTEPLVGPDARFVRKIVEAQPALLLVDAASSTLPWERWIQTLKTAAATRRIPIVAFGPHVEREVLQRARQAGADDSITRGRLHSSLAEIIDRWAKIIDHGALAEACQGSLSRLAAQGVGLLNDGEYYAAHESLETAWMEADDLEGTLYRALLQVAVACLQVERRNYAGAVKMLLRLRQWLEPLPESCRGVDVDALKLQVAEFSRVLEAAGPDRIGEVELRPLPVLVRRES